MSNRLTDGKEENAALSALVNPKTFGSLSESQKDVLIAGVVQQQQKDGGLMGRLFGTDKDIASRNIAFASVVLLVIVGVVASFTGYNQIWQLIITGIMTVIGYFFGRSS